MIKNNVYYNFFSSYRQPNPEEVGYWIDLKSDPNGRNIKFYDSNLKKWVNIESICNTDDALSETSTNPVQNKVITSNLFDIINKLEVPEDNKKYGKIGNNGLWKEIEDVVTEDIVVTGTSVGNLTEGTKIKKGTNITELLKQMLIKNNNYFVLNNSKLNLDRLQ